MLRKRSQIGAAVAVSALLLAFALPVLGGASSAGGPWSYTRQGVTCQWSGSHSAADGQAYGQTNDYNGNCNKLRVRLKYNPGNIDSGWKTSVGEPGIYIWPAPLNTTAVSSEHTAQNPFDLSFSGVARPHAW